MKKRAESAPKKAKEPKAAVLQLVQTKPRNSLLQNLDMLADSIDAQIKQILER